MPNSFTDCFGRIATQDQAGLWKTDGVTIGPCSAEQARITLSGMAPPSYVPPVNVAVPQSVCNVQLRLALLQSPGAHPSRSLFHDVDDALRQSGETALQLWEYAGTIERTGLLAGLLANPVGLSGPLIDILFRTASRLSA